MKLSLLILISLSLLVFALPVRAEDDPDLDGEDPEAGSYSPSQQLSVNQTKPLLFPLTAAGDGPFSVAPSSGAHFLVTGKPNRRFRIFLPASPVTVSHPAGGTITISGWTSIPHKVGRTGADGRQVIYVGATRATLNPFLASGKYSGKFSIGVRRFRQQPSTLGDAIVPVMASLSLTRVADLTFPRRVQGDPATTVPPGSPAAASFTLQGEPNKQYVLIVPDSIVLRAGSGGSAQSQLNVSGFQTNVPRCGSLPPSGRETVSVGATLGAIPAFQQSGTYRGTIVLSVTYQ